MLLFSEFLPENNNTKKEQVDGTADSEMRANVFPGCFHFFTPVDVIENENGIIVHL